MGDSRRIYLRQVAKRLCCPPEERTRLLAGLENEMAECCPGGAGLSAEVLASRFGAPEDVAAELQRVVPAESVLRYGRRKRLLTRLVLAACLMAVVLSLGFAVHVANHDVHYVETQIFYD